MIWEPKTIMHEKYPHLSETQGQPQIKFEDEFSLRGKNETHCFTFRKDNNNNNNRHRSYRESKFPYYGAQKTTAFRLISFHSIMVHPPHLTITSLLHSSYSAIGHYPPPQKMIFGSSAPFGATVVLLLISPSLPHYLSNHRIIFSYLQTQI